MPRVATEPRAIEDVDAVGQSRGDLRNAHRPRPCRGDLDRERQAVESAAEVDDDRKIVVVDVGARVAAPFEEQLHRWACPRVAVTGRNGQRRERDDRLARHLERGAAGGDDCRLVARAEHLHDRGGHGIEQVLAVVDEQQHGPIVRRAEERVERVEAEVVGDGAGHDRLVVHAGQIDEARPPSRIDSRGVRPRPGRAPSCRRRPGPPP